MKSICDVTEVILKYLDKDSASKMCSGILCCGGINDNKGAYEAIKTIKRDINERTEVGRKTKTTI